MGQSVANHQSNRGIKRLPGEFETQAALMVAWPHQATDWAPCLTQVREEIKTLIEATLAHQSVILLRDPKDPDPLPPGLAAHPKLLQAPIPFDDTWCRDFGPIGLVSETMLHLVDFQFSAWGKDYANNQDNEVTAKLATIPGFDSLVGPIKVHQSDFVLEGGAIESNGQGTILVNWHCLQTRHSEMQRAELIERLKSELCAQEIIGIDIPPHAGDDTDGHIDTLVRFIGPDTLVVQTLADEALNNELMRQVSELEVLGADGEHHRANVVVLPAVEHSSTLPLNYVNFVLINNACLVPVYGLASDDAAVKALSQALPSRQIVPILSRDLITQFGGPHCATMHFPDIEPNLSHSRT